MIPRPSRIKHAQDILDTISHPATMTYASVPDEERNRLGITDGLIRLSVGIEDVKDLEADLSRSLAFCRLIASL